MTSINPKLNQGGYYYSRNNEENYPKRYYYKEKSAQSAEIGWILASAASGLIYKLLPSFSNPFLKQITKEHSQNHLYKDVFQKAYEASGLKEKGLQIVRDTNPVTDVGKGLNAYFTPLEKKIVINTEKASIAGFHELGHAINNMKGGIGRFLQKFRKPGYTIAGLMASVAVLARKKPKGEDRNVFDFVQDNCGKIAFLSLMPTVIEEAMASHKGIKLAKENGLSEALVKNLKKFYGKALLSYGGYALVTGLAVFVASKITEIFTRPQRIN